MSSSKTDRVFSLQEIARIIGGRVIGDGSITITGISPLDKAGPGDISFFLDRRYLSMLEDTRASAVIVGEENPAFKGPQVVVSNPGAGFAKASHLFYSEQSWFSGTSPHAFIHESSSIGEGSTIYPSVYVGKDVLIGRETVIYPGVFIGDGVEIGDRTVIYPNVTVMSRCSIGNGVVIHAGTVIGSDGFGFVREGNSSIKIPQTGTVRIEDNVEIGAGNCIDRATFDTTWIKSGVKTDNLVHIAHNVVIGEGTIIVAQAGISGSVTIGRSVVIGGQVGIVDHVHIGDHVMIGSQSGVPKSIPAGEIRSGSPALPHRLFLKVASLIPRLPGMFERLRALEKRIKRLEDKKEE